LIVTTRGLGLREPGAVLVSSSMVIVAMKCVVKFRYQSRDSARVHSKNAVYFFNSS
jgi:hypothetical protein